MHAPSRPAASAVSGFTLVEMMVTLGLTGVNDVADLNRTVVVEE